MQPDPSDYGLTLDRDECLLMDGVKLTDVAKEFGTPVHVVNGQRLVRDAQKFADEAKNSYPGPVSVHFAFKSNSVPGIVELIRGAGLKAEVMSEYELTLALRLGYEPKEIIVNGPCKTREFLARCVQSAVRFILVDSAEELIRIDGISREIRKRTNILLRVNPGFRPGRINRGSIAASRKTSPFGLDLVGGEVEEALDLVADFRYVDFHGFHIHIGTGIRRSGDHARALSCLSYLHGLARRKGFELKVLDIGGGFPSPTSREMTDSEMLLYQSFGILPRFGKSSGPLTEYFRKIAEAVRIGIGAGVIPELIFEPGRSITSQNQVLLLRVHYVKHRAGKRTWLITDGGLGTVTMPTFYEYHEIFPCSGATRQRKQLVNIIGPACFSGDVVYKNKRMPEIMPGEVLAVMDSGAYFTALESSFGFYRPAIVAIDGGRTRLLRRSETFDDSVSRDFMERNDYKGGNDDEVRSSKRRNRPFAGFNRRRSHTQIHRKWRGIIG